MIVHTHQTHAQGPFHVVHPRINALKKGPVTVQKENIFFTAPWNVTMGSTAQQNAFRFLLLDASLDRTRQQYFGPFPHLSTASTLPLSALFTTSPFSSFAFIAQLAICILPSALHSLCNQHLKNFHRLINNKKESSLKNIMSSWAWKQCKGNTAETLFLLSDEEDHLDLICLTCS